jgi:hypothetical protein
MITCVERPKTSARNSTRTSESNIQSVVKEITPAKDAEIVETTVDSQPPREFRVGRFIVGLLLAGIGMATILMVGVSLLYVRGLDPEIAMPTVALSVVLGVMFVGGGFGLMATASSGIDEQEFSRLMRGESLPSDPINDPMFGYAQDSSQFSDN